MTGIEETYLPEMKGDLGQEFNECSALRMETDAALGVRVGPKEEYMTDSCTAEEKEQLENQIPTRQISPIG